MVYAWTPEKKLQQKPGAENDCQNRGDFLQLAGQHAADAALDVVGGAAVGLSVFIGAAVIYRQGNLGGFQSHAQKGGDPKPEQGPGAAHRNSGSHAADVAHAHGAADGGGDRGESTHMAGAHVMLFFFEKGAKGSGHEMPKVPELEKAGSNGKEGAGPENEDDQRRAP